MTKIEPFPGEQLVMRLKPHFLSFWHLYVVCGLMVTLALLLKWIYGAMTNLQWLGFLSKIPVLGRYNLPHILIFWTTLISIAIAISMIYVRATPVLVFGLIALLGTVATEYLKMPLETHSWLLVFSGLIGFVVTELYRQGHSYYITNLRLIMRKSFLSNDSRQLVYGQISDISVVQGLFGRIFNFGTVIPVAVSGLGLGQDSVMAELGTGLSMRSRMTNPFGVAGGLSAGGGRAVHLPRGRTYHTLYGVSNPNDVAETLARMMTR